MARQYFVEIGEPQRRRVIARRQSYHGNTLGALAAGGNAWRRAQFEPLLIEAHHIDPCYAYRHQREGESDAAYAARAAQALEDKILETRPGTRDRLRRRDGGRRDARRGASGRRLFQAHPRDLRPLRRAADPRRGDVRHGAHRNAARLRAGGRRARPDDDRQGPRRRLPADRRGAAAQAHFRGLRRAARARSSTATPIWAIRWPRRRRSRCRTSSARQLLANVVAMGGGFSGASRSASPTARSSATFAGAGSFARSNLSRDRTSKRAFDPALELHARVKREAMARGLMVYPMGGTVDGVSGDHCCSPRPSSSRRSKSMRSSSASAKRSMRRLAADDRRAPASAPQKEHSAQPEAPPLASCDNASPPRPNSAAGRGSKGLTDGETAAMADARPHRGSRAGRFRARPAARAPAVAGGRNGDQEKERPGGGYFPLRKRSSAPMPG